MEMFHTPSFKRRPFQGVLSLLGLVLVSFTFLASAPFHMSNEHTLGGLDPRIIKIINAPPYRHAEWGLREVDPSTGRIVHALPPQSVSSNPARQPKSSASRLPSMTWGLIIA
jgi:hypothetical protein